MNQRREALAILESELFLRIAEQEILSNELQTLGRQLQPLLAQRQAMNRESSRVKRQIEEQKREKTILSQVYSVEELG